MKRTLLTFVLVYTALVAFGQFNLTLVSQLQYPGNANDIWGYAAPDGTEYALVGLRAGVSIVTLADPANPQEVAFIEGPNSTWRDIKTWGTYAYVTTDQPGTEEGLLVIDLSNLPNSVSHFNWTPTFPDLPGGALETCHNLYIDEFGFCYLAGCNLNGGGMIILDVFTTPGQPQYVGPAPSVYAHDVYVRDNRMYASEIYNGTFGIYDVSNKQNITLLANQQTPFLFTHNAWLSDDGSVLYTTDEKANAPVGAYDISDLSDIQELDQFRPTNTLGSGVIPHNVHVWDDYLIISYYTDGGVIVDASRPENLIEVGSFDTFLGNDGGFSGAWGAYPFLPSGLVLVSDINSGLFVLEPDYKRACHLEGTVTAAGSGNKLSGVKVEILSSDPNLATTDLLGDYKTGQATAGTFEVRFSKPGYIPKVETVVLVNGQLTTLDVALEVAAILEGVVIRNTDGQAVPNAEVQFINDEAIFTVKAGADGNFQTPIDLATYSVIAGAWGYLHYTGSVDVTATANVVITLSPGYQDDFIFDQGWEIEGTASSGDWEWVIPIESVLFNQVSSPGQDVASDLGDRCYVTGNGGNGGDNDVDNGVVRLLSPPMDLSSFNEPVLHYTSFFFNGGGTSQTGAPNDALEVYLSHANGEVLLEQITNSANEWNAPTAINLSGLADFSDEVRIVFQTSDLPGTGHIVEAAVDAFLVEDADPSATTAASQAIARLTVAPNPFQQATFLDLSGYDTNDTFTISVFDAQGRIVFQQTRIWEKFSAIEMGVSFAPGVYYLTLSQEGKVLDRQKLVKFE